jgi:hypothetical protein
MARTVKVTTLAAVCAAHAAATIDFLSVDVEGYEREVLAGGDFARFRPRVVVVEATRPNTQIPTHEGWEPLLIGADYRFAAFDGLNRYYVRNEDEALLPAFATPVNVFDGYETYECHALKRYVATLEARVQQMHDEMSALQDQLRAALLRAQTAEAALGSSPGEGALAVARKLEALYNRYPRLMSAAGRLLR